ncbi:hypothetical protein [Comamonas aquatica]|uniref:hypothetical protein n=1 Tax=Comamonas aquatica TaxID=225991 RepID=UPI00244A23A7|nr:hypothetical protein [Comamonas aquatica]MDH1814967.1 hypothetical protein [Comamonas aquatica]
MAAIIERRRACATASPPWAWLGLHQAATPCCAAGTPPTDVLAAMLALLRWLGPVLPGLQFKKESSLRCPNLLFNAIQA